MKAAMPFEDARGRFFLPYELPVSLYGSIVLFLTGPGSAAVREQQVAQTSSRVSRALVQLNVSMGVDEGYSNDCVDGSFETASYRL
jgi:hypothetical protein